MLHKSSKQLLSRQCSVPMGKIGVAKWDTLRQARSQWNSVTKPKFLSPLLKTSLILVPKQTTSKPLNMNLFGSHSCSNYGWQSRNTQLNIAAHSLLGKLNSAQDTTEVQFHQSLLKEPMSVLDFLSDHSGRDYGQEHRGYGQEHYSSHTERSASRGVMTSPWLCRSLLTLSQIQPLTPPLNHA